MRKYKFDVGDIIIYERKHLTKHNKETISKYHLLVQDIDVDTKKMLGVYKRPKPTGPILKSKTVKGYMTIILDGPQRILEYGTVWRIPKDECEEHCTLHA